MSGRVNSPLFGRALVERTKIDHIRWWVPQPISSMPSLADPSTLITSAVAYTSWPTGVAAKCCYLYCSANRAFTCIQKRSDAIERGVFKIITGVASTCGNVALAPWGRAMDVGDWLRSVGLVQYEPMFRAHEIDDEVLPELSEGDLEKLGVPLGHRKRLMKAIAALDRDGPYRRQLSPVQPRRRTRTSEGGAAILRADEGRLHCRGPDRSRSGLADPIVRPERGRNPLLPQAGLRVVGLLPCSAFDRCRLAAAPA